MIRANTHVPLILQRASVSPMAASAQQPAIPVVGFLHTQSAEPFSFQTDAFRNGLIESGFIQGRNVAVEYRWARGQYDRLPALAADLVRQQVAVIATGGGAVFSPCGKVRDLDDTNCLHHRWRSGQAWLGREPQSAGQQYDWDKPLHLCPMGEAAGAIA